MRDESFSCFIDDFGEATYHQAAPQEAINRWRGKLPDKLLHYWQTEGLNGYANGRFWIVNPDDYEDIVDEWLDGSPLEQLDRFHVIARTAFGKLYLCGERIGCEAKIECSLHGIFVMDLKPKEPTVLEREQAWFFSSRSPDEVDLHDVNDEPLFDRALAALGPLAPDEMYGFEPALVLGGRITLDRLRKVKIDQHLTILRQLAAPTMPFGNIDIQKLLKSGT